MSEISEIFYKVNYCRFRRTGL